MFEQFDDRGGRWYATHNGRGHPHCSALFADSITDLVEQIWAVDEAYYAKLKRWQAEQQLPLILRRWIQDMPRT